ncbi:MAG: hypothetical protein KF874_05095 [Rhizobiaceae bacterium]|nr:hypothetical protein [Rhizobiaceae bacterium]
MNTRLKPVWAGRTMRLDPFRLAQTVSFQTEDDAGGTTYSINHRGAVIRRALERSGLPMTIALPARAFLGVAARAMEDNIGNLTVTLELMHEDPDLSVPLLVARDLDDVAADWRAWSTEYKLPMLMVDPDGTPRTLEESLGGGVVARKPIERRKRRSRTAKRRPRFLMRRKAGTLGVRLVVSGQEIIARA